MLQAVKANYLPALVAIVGVALSAALAILERDTGAQLAETEFRQHADTLASAVQNGFARDMEALQAIGAFYAHSSNVTRDEFQGFAHKLLARHGDLRALAWVPRVAQFERAKYEAAARREGIPAYTFGEWSQDGRPKPAAARPEYFPVYFVEPRAGNEAWMGLDLASRADWREAMQASLGSDDPIAVPPGKSVADLVVFLSIFRPRSSVPADRVSADEVLGFAVGAIRIGDMIDLALKDSETGAMEISLLDTAPQTGILYRRTTTPTGARGDGRYRVESPLQMAGLRWALRVESTKAFTSAHDTTWVAWGILGSGLLITALMLAYLRTAASRIRDQQDHVAALNESNQRLGREIVERKEVAATQKRLNRALRILSGCNSALVHVREEPSLLHEICRLIVELGDYRLAWVGYARADKAKTVVCVAKAGQSAQFVDEMAVTWADDERGRGPTGTAIRERRTVVARALPVDSGFAEWCEEAKKYGYAACVSIPIRGGGEVLGAINIYADLADAFDSEEVQLLEELADDLGYGILSLREGEVRERVERELDYQTNYDSLTALPNRSLFLDRLGQDLIHAGRDQRIAVVLSIDIDRFQAVNDGFGHGTGDALLRHLGQSLSRNLREGDTLARLAADEFALVLNNVTADIDIAGIIRRLLAAAREPLTVGGKPVSVSVSIGASLFPKDGQDAGSLMKSAVAAMHNAKTLGGNTFRFYAPEMNAQMSARFALETEIRRAIEGNELLVHYQPKVSLATGQIVGAEALVRWQNPERGLVPPADFIPLAEETGLIQAIGEWVLDAVCVQLKAWLDAGIAVPPLAVNLSARQFHQQNLVAIVEQALRVHEVSAEWLELEITESMLMGDWEQAIATLKHLRALGVKVSLDDFGAGYSSLSYLNRLPVTSLKIDRAFVQDITTDPDEAAICVAIIDLAHNLKLKVVAEGVETEGQLNYLRTHHCDQIQGYLFSRPLPPAEFVELIAAGKTLPLPVRDSPLPTILLVDDEPNMLSALKRALRPDGYRILAASSGRDGLEVLANNDVQVILSDQRMPAMSGTEFLERVRSLYPDTIRIVLSGYTDLQSITDAINRGAIYKFLTKPWESDLLRENIREAFRHHDFAKSARK